MFASVTFQVLSPQIFIFMYIYIAKCSAYIEITFVCGIFFSVCLFTFPGINI